ncbi:ABC transporter substrate-binding protein [Actinoplanes couchii]|uniref:Glycine/betaine-binding protein n=1 Tax=Actinoplanes couchii TaxID=403638 RepID=A0ABQ3XMD8_9ACTN|nr:ABC transporter substrate-binding protein [Actinoplanes couchii]MDR6321569.1 glycine betaine/proline transport system substrate-binding protein [Actinoplanes couchii]GID59665.1 glycine/betaine-binding protein [Actinoplanes couchii]
MVIKRFAQALTAISLAVVAGCANTEAAVTPPPGVPSPNTCGTVNLAINPWSGSAANVAVVGYLLKEELRCKVNTYELSETASWAGFVDGSIDVILENWGHDDLKKKYIDGQKVAVALGMTGNKGVLGWYVPQWMAEEHPEILDWRNLNDYTDLLKTTATGTKGQFLGGDPSFVTKDTQLIENLKLNYTLVYAGSEDKLIAAFRRAQKQKTPLLGYFYEPQWLLSDVKLTKIPLPRYKPGCDADADAVTCDYQPYDLDKVARKKFVDSGSPAATFLKNWTWTNDDQNAVARDLTQGKMTPDQAAKKWADTNREVWEKWLP